MESKLSTVDIWGLKTNNFVKVSTVMYSPNHWEDSSKKGAKHFFFMLNGCVSEESPRGFYNEFLDEKLTPHRKVFEALGSKMKVPEDSRGLCGLGFHEDKRNHFIVKVTGATERMLKVNI